MSSIKSKEEFNERFNKLLNTLELKTNKTTSENVLLKTLIEVNDYINRNIDLKSKKESYNNMLPYFEMSGGWELMKSDIGQEATDVLYYFVENF